MARSRPTLYFLRQITQLANADVGVFLSLTPVVLSCE